MFRKRWILKWSLNLFVFLNQNRYEFRFQNLPGKNQTVEWSLWLQLPGFQFHFQ